MKIEAKTKSTYEIAMSLTDEVCDLKLLRIDTRQKIKELINVMESNERNTFYINKLNEILKLNE
jgi:hypothetical protein